MAPRLIEAFPEVTEVADALRAVSATVAVAESCTGGLLGATLTALPGSSGFMRGGVIAYADDVKAEHLGVSRHLLARHGAVSDPVARALAEGARARFEADIGIGVTGVAGPGGGTVGKPAGLVFVAIVWPEGVETVRLDGDHGREGNRARAVHAALQLCGHVARRLRGPS